LKYVSDEIKKKQNLLKNREDGKKILDELCKKYVNRMYWEDLEKPMHKLFIDPNSEAAYLNYLAKKGLLKFNTQVSENQETPFNPSTSNVNTQGTIPTQTAK
jgi:hypothetical protein